MFMLMTVICVNTWAYPHKQWKDIAFKVFLGMFMNSSVVASNLRPWVEAGSHVYLHTCILLFTWYFWWICTWTYLEVYIWSNDVKCQRRHTTWAPQRQRIVREIPGYFRKMQLGEILQFGQIWYKVADLSPLQFWKLSATDGTISRI